jgi:hypothetical protein
MPEPISSSNPLVSSSYDPHLDEEGLVCRSEPPTEAPSPAVGKLVGAVSKPPSALPAPSPSTARNNAERTSERVGISPYASAGPAGVPATFYAGAALLKGHDPKSGLDVEVLSVSAQVGDQEEWQAGLLRFGKSTSVGSFGVESFTVRATSGLYNDDGSVGLNMGAQATALGAEATYGTANSATLGLSAGAGAAGSIGVRDQDKDGEHEICAKVSYGPLTVGGCIETPF